MGFFLLSQYCSLINLNTVVNISENIYNYILNVCFKERILPKFYSKKRVRHLCFRDCNANITSYNHKYIEKIILNHNMKFIESAD